MSTDGTPAPPKAFTAFSRLFPKAAEAWQLLSEAGESGPLAEKERRLIKLGVAIASRSQGATHSGVRKCLAAGASKEEIYQVVALAASTIGLPNAVAAFTWLEDELRK